mgnify:FL=1
MIITFLLLPVLACAYFLSVGMYGAALGAAVVGIMIILFIAGAL